MACCLPILALAAASPVDVTATKLDGTVHIGRLQAWSDAGLVLATAAGPIEIAEADLLSLQFASPSPPAAAAATTDSGQPIIELVDGTVLPLADFAVTSTTATARLRQPPPAEPQTIAVPLRQVRAVRLQPLDAAVLPQWQEIRALARAQRLDRRAASAAARVSTTWKASSAKSPTAKSSSRSTAKQSALRGARLLGSSTIGPITPPEDAPQVCVAGPRRPARSRLRGTLEGDMLQRRNGSGHPTNVAARGYFHGRFLGRQGGLFERPGAGHAIVAAAGRPCPPPPRAPPSTASHASIDRPSGGPADAACSRTVSASDGTGRSESFAKGLAVRSRTELVYRLPRGYSRFMAVAGIEPTAAASGNVMLTMFGDDRLLVEASIAGSRRRRCPSNWTWPASNDSRLSSTTARTSTPAIGSTCAMRES